MNSFVLLLPLSIMMEIVVAQPIPLNPSPVFMEISEPLKKALSDIPNHANVFQPHLLLESLLNTDLLSQLITPFNIFLELLQQQKFVAPMLWANSLLQPILPFLQPEEVKSILNPLAEAESAQLQKLANFQQSLNQLMENSMLFQPILSKVEEFHSRLTNFAQNNFKDLLVKV